MGLNMDLPDCKNPNSNDIVSYSVKNRKTLQGAQLYLIQMTALLVYKFHHTRRDWKGALANIMLPVLFVTMAMGMFNLKPLVIDDPPLKLSFDLYSNEQALFFSSDPGDSSNFSEMLLRKYGDKNNMCIYTRTNLSCWHTLIEKNKIEPCKYFNSNQVCPMFDVLASSSKNGNSCILYNLSGLNIEEYIFALAIKDSYGGWSFTRKLQSAGISKTQAKVWYSQKGFHALPSYLNYLNNIILWKNLPSNADWKQYGITVYSKPYQGAIVDEDEILENVRQCGVALCITLGFSILTASIGSCVVKDHVSGAKYLYHISGLNYKIYWIGHFLHDMALYLVPASLCVCVIASFQLTAFTFRENLAASALLLILFGYATLPWMYLVSGCFPSSDAAFISYTSINFVSGLCTLLLTFLPRLLAGISKAEVGKLSK
ncbi:ATP-binding cassette sub-family A member 13-like [Mixophyes fleayi]|uniref:ATP-binding cassette sub-family A member 13-like n=1 Tax=Mixophyes fleayi TaxID=3061075 RepID=UPI003F4D98E2